MNELKQLRERVEKAEGPDELSRTEFYDALARVIFGAEFTFADSGLCRDALRSIDSAVALIERKLPGWRWIVDSDFDRGPPYAAQVKARGATWAETYRPMCKTPALALIAALLSALETHNG